MSKIKGYPKKIGHKYYYVRHPILITPDIAERCNTDEETAPLLELVPGKWIAVDVQPRGYSYLLSPVQFDAEEECQKACDLHNRFAGYTPKDVIRIISTSMELEVSKKLPPELDFQG